MGSDNLIPFDTDRAKAAAAKSVEARKARKLAAAGDPPAVAGALALVVSTFKRGDLGDSAAAAAGFLVGRIVSGAIPIRNGSEAADVLRVLVDVARLESGEATSVALVGHVSTSAAMAEKLAELRARAASTVVDVPASGVLDVVEVGPCAAATAADDPAPSHG